MPGGLTAAEARLDVFAARGGVALAVSGGADSLGLMLLMAHAVKRVSADPGRIVVYSVDHALRPEAAGEAAHVVATARSRGFRARTLRWNGEKPATGILAAARSARYRLIAEAMRQDGMAELLTAHHMADQAETVLMRLAHGSGIDGLQGMRSTSLVEGCRVVRPLLDVHPRLLRNLVVAEGLQPAEDPSNADPHYERVRWRQFQPQLDAMGLTIERLSAFAGRMSDASALIDREAADAHGQLVSPDEAGARLALPAVRALNPLVRVALLDAVLAEVSGDSRPVPLAPLEAICARIAAVGVFRAETLHGCVIAVRRGEVQVRREGPRRSAVLGQENKVEV